MYKINIDNSSQVNLLQERINNLEKSEKLKMDKTKFDKTQQSLVSFINHLLTFNNQHSSVKEQFPGAAHLPFRFNIKSSIMANLADKCKAILTQEPNLLRLEAPFYIFGDIHGQFDALIRFLEMTGLPDESKLLFMGDYVDRGPNSIEVLALLFALKLRFPNKVYLLRGNHECPEVNKEYGFYEECVNRYGLSEGENLFNQLNDTLLTIPIAATINDKIFCVHAGISPDLKKLDQLNGFNRRVNIPSNGILCDIMWSDPKFGLKTWSENNSRGISYHYGEDTLMEFLNNNGLDLMCRAHQLVVNGYQFFCNNRMVTIFSAPNYCGECGNDGAVMKMTADLECSFQIIKPVNKMGK